MNVIFLDIDGVLNTEQNLLRLATLGKPTIDEFGVLFDPKSVRLLKEHIDKFGTKLVISSTWRYDGMDKLQEMWTHRKLPGEIVGMTPCMDERLDSGIWVAVSRGIEIQRHLISHAEIEKYAIIDDNVDFLDNQLEVFVHTTWTNGLCESHLEQLNSIFE